MNIAIVGTSHLLDTEIESALFQIERILEKARVNGDTIVTGDARGIDYLVRTTASRIKDLKLIVMISKKKQWDGNDGFKVRNLRIVEKADYVYSISTMVKRKPCYHCITRNHERTGGCWTLLQALKRGKKGEVIII